MIAERIKELRDFLDLSQTEFGRKTGLSRDAVNNLEHNRAKISDTTLIAICSIYNVSREWLETGEGEMFNISPVDPLDQLANQHNLGPGGKALLKAASRVIEELDEETALSLLDQLIQIMQDAIANKQFAAVDPDSAESSSGSSSVG